MKRNAGYSGALILRFISATSLLFIFGCQAGFVSNNQNSRLLNEQSQAQQLELIDQSLDLGIDCLQIDNSDERCDLNSFGVVEKTNKIIERIKKYIKALWKIVDILSVVLSDEASTKLAQQIKRIEDKFVELAESSIALLDPADPGQLKIQKDLEDLIEFVRAEIAKMIEELQ
jgi:predicted RND superfamily exporter protein